MIDHLLRFTDDATAQVDPIVGTYWNTDAGSWRGDVCIPDVGVYTVTGTQTVTDPITGLSFEQEIRSYYPGWFIVIALLTLDADLRDLPNGECRLIADRDAAVAGQSFILYLAQDIDPSVLSVSRVEPTFAGSDYPFGS